MTNVTNVINEPFSNLINDIIVIAVVFGIALALFSILMRIIRGLKVINRLNNYYEEDKELIGWTTETKKIDPYDSSSLWED